MHTRKISRDKITGIASRTLLAIILLMYCAIHSFARQTTEKKIPVRFAQSDSLKISLKQILADPALTAKEAGCEVTGFTVTFAPKGGFLHGPYKTKGNKLDENEINYLKEFTNIKVTIILEDIQVTCKDKNSTNGAIVVTSIPE